MGSLHSSCARRMAWWLAALLPVLLAASGPARAGGPLFVRADGQPYRWNLSQPIRYQVDPGSLGRRSHAAAVALVERAVQSWEQLPAAPRFRPAGELARHITGANILGFLQGFSRGDPSAFLFDSNGSVIDALFGQGASSFFIGFGWPHRTDPQSARITAGVVVLNGRVSPLYTDDYYLWDCTHELGHLLGLGHSQLNEEVKYDGDPANDDLSPIMFYPGPNTHGRLHRDDQAWFSWLYPTAATYDSTGAIRGRVLLPDGVTGLQGVHVIARRVGDPQVTAVSGISGFLFRGVYPAVDLLQSGNLQSLRMGGWTDPAHLGEFVIPGLPPGSYTLELQDLDVFPAVPVPAAFLVGGPKYWRDGSSAHDPPLAFTPIVVNAGQEVSGIDLVLNGEGLGDPRPVAAQAPNRLPNAQPVSLPAVIAGSLDGAGSAPAGPVIPSDQDLQAVYSVTLSEWTTVTAILSAADAQADLDLYLLEQQGAKRVVLAASTDPGTPPELIQQRLPPGSYYFGVYQNGSRAAAYTLRLMASPAPNVAPPLVIGWIQYLLLGDVTDTGATARWRTDSPTPSVLYYDQPFREIGSTRRETDHTLSLTDLKPAAYSLVAVSAAAGPKFLQLDQVVASLTTASPPAAGGAPHLVIDSSPFLFPNGIAEVDVTLSNLGAGDALGVRIEQVTLAPGWAILTSHRDAASLPPVLEAGRIGAGGAGALVLRLMQQSGTAAPAVTVHGTYTDAAGTTLRF